MGSLKFHVDSFEKQKVRGIFLLTFISADGSVKIEGEFPEFLVKDKIDAGDDVQIVLSEEKLEAEKLKDFGELITILRGIVFKRSASGGMISLSAGGLQFRISDEMGFVPEANELYFGLIKLV